MPEVECYRACAVMQAHSKEERILNTENVFPWKESAQVRSAYEENNYLISETGNATGRAIIFFSSNGIYYPNDENIFAKGTMDLSGSTLHSTAEFRNTFRKSSLCGIYTNSGM